MGINVKFTVAVIAVVVIGFTASSYFFSTQPISIVLFDKSPDPESPYAISVTS